VLLLCVLNVLSQSAKQKSTPNKHREIPPEKISVHTDPWEGGEIKPCATFSGYPYVLACNYTKRQWSESLINLVGDNVAKGMSADEAWHDALMTAKTRSKEFMVKFFDDEGHDPEPWPEPISGRKITWWECTKDTVISCSLHGRQD